MKKIILGILTLLFMASAGYCQDSEQPLQLTISTDDQVYLVGDSINIGALIERKNGGQAAKLYSPDYEGVSKIVVTNSNGVIMKPSRLKIKRKPFDQFMSIAPWEKGVSQFDNLTWFDCGGAWQFTGETQLKPDTYKIYITMTNPPEDGCGENKNFEKTDLSGTIRSNVITIGVVDHFKLGMKELPFFSSVEQKGGVIKLVVSDRPSRMLMNIMKNQEQQVDNARHPDFRETIELRLGEKIKFYEHHSSYLVEPVYQDDKYSLKVQSHFDARSFGGELEQKTFFIPIPEALDSEK